MTYRERREARAERLRGWAEKRETKAAGVFASHEVHRGDYAFNTQPGHIPERARVIAQTGREYASLKKARSMAAKADNIEAATAHAIYSDDPDAIERLREKLAGLEAKREQRKAANAAYRKEHRDELKAMTAYERGQAVPYPSYSISNLGGTITTTRKRLADLERQAARAAEGTDTP